MKLIIGESGLTYLQRLAYRGVIGIFYEDTLGGVLAYVIFAVILIFAVIGFLSILKGLFFKRKKKDNYDYKYFK